MINETQNHNVNSSGLHFLLPKYHEGIEKCFEAATSCWISADAFIGEQDMKRLEGAIEAALSCAEVCAATVKVMVNHGKITTNQLLKHLRQCSQACRDCIRECSPHCANLEHCLICVKTCEECLRTCESYVQDIELHIA